MATPAGFVMGIFSHAMVKILKAKIKLREVPESLFFSFAPSRRTASPNG
jgi:hypothetical protein